MVELRDYQREAVERVEESWGAGERPLLCMATGVGKTVVMGQLARDVADSGGRVLFLAHRGELLDQAGRTMGRFGLQCDREQAGEVAGTVSDVTLGSVQSVCRDERLARLGGSGYTHVFVDEAHHSRSDTYLSVLSAMVGLNGAKLLGVTATPDRGDKKTLAKVFDRIVYQYDLPDAVRDGWLCPIRCLMEPLEIDISHVSVKSGDYSEADAGAALEPYLPDIASKMCDAGCGSERKTVVFCPLVSTAQKLASFLTGWGIEAEWVSGADPGRDGKLSAFAKATGGVLCNSMLLTEGWDCPDVSCVVVLRPTRSRSLFCQMVGRGTRKAPGKENLLLLDFLWQTAGHDLCRPSCLVARDGAVRAKMDQMDGEFDVMNAEEAAAQSVEADREAALAKELEANRKRKAKLVDPLQWAATVHDYDLMSYVPTFAWEKKQPTDKQLKTVENFGIDPSSIGSLGQASKVIDTLTARAHAGLATPKQVRCLERKGFGRTDEWTFSEASQMISRIKSNGWRVPWGIDPASYVPPRLDEPKHVTPQVPWAGAV